MIYYNSKKGWCISVRKTIFELKDSEGKKVERELLNTAYGRQYNMVIGILLLFPIVLVICDVITAFVDKSDDYFSRGIMFDIAYLFITLLFFIICKLKWFELIKTYYDEVYSKNKKETHKEK
jgi:hypothetical protein